MIRRPRFGSTAKAAVLVILAAVAFGACSSTDRPGGTVERFAESLSHGVHEDMIFDLGSREAADALLGEPFVASDRNESNFTMIEVAPPIDETTDEARVPIQVTRADEPETPVAFEATTVRRDGDWYVQSAVPLARDIAFPSDGGPGVVENTKTVIWLSLAVFAGCLLVSMAVIRIVGGRRPPEVSGHKPGNHDAAAQGG